MKLSSRLLIIFGHNFCKKTTNLGIWILNPSLGKLGVTYDLGWWLIGKPMLDFLFALIELFFTIYYGSKIMWRNVYKRGWPLCSQSLPEQGRPPSTTLGIRKLETLGYPMVKTTFLCIPSLTQYWSVTDRQMPRFAIYSTCKAGFAAHWKNWNSN